MSFPPQGSGRFRLAVRWDELLMLMTPKVDRGHLTIDEQQALFRQGLEDELARATAHIPAPIGSTGVDEHKHKIIAAAYWIVSASPKIRLRSVAMP